VKHGMMLDDIRKLFSRWIELEHILDSNLNPESTEFNVFPLLRKTEEFILLLQP
jgi:hypothetical protein